MDAAEDYLTSIGYEFLRFVVKRSSHDLKSRESARRSIEVMGIRATKY